MVFGRILADPSRGVEGGAIAKTPAGEEDICWGAGRHCLPTWDRVTALRRPPANRSLFADALLGRRNFPRIPTF